MSSRKFTLTPYHGNEIISKANTFIELEFRTDISFDNWNETPEKIYSDSLIPDELGISNLIYHLKNNI